MRYIRYAFLGALAVCLITVALANSAPVTLNLLPADVATLLSVPAAMNSIDVPLFLVIFAAIIAGLLIGFVWEYLREHKFRADASRQRREKERLEREVAKARASAPEDDVLALLDQPGNAR